MCRAVELERFRKPSANIGLLSPQPFYQPLRILLQAASRNFFKLELPPSLQLEQSIDIPTPYTKWLQLSASAALLCAQLSPPSGRQLSQSLSGA